MAHILMLPGLPIGPEQFDLAAEELRADGHTVLALSYPGYDGDPVPAGLDFDGYVEFVEQQIGHSGPHVVAGVSFGAQLALVLAGRRPDLVSALVLSNTQGGAPTSAETAMFNDVAGAAEAHGTAVLAQDLTGLLLCATTRAERPAVVARFAELLAKAPGAAVASAFRALAGRPDPAELLPAVKAPVTLVFGTSDGATSTADADALAAGLVNATIRHINGSGHYPPLETPEAYLTELRAALAASSG